MALLNLQLLLWSLLGSICSLYAVDWGANVSGSFTDVDIRIVSSAVALNGLVQVHAASKDVAVSLTQDSSLNSGSSSNSRLFLTANAGRTIDFLLDHDLNFQGAQKNDLMVVINGGGQVNFVLDGGRKVSFTSNKVSQGAARVFVLMDNNVTHPTLQFNRSAVHNGDDVEIVIGQHASLGYLAGTTVESGLASEVGSISFDAANTGNGLMIVRLENEASITIAGHLVHHANKTFNLSDVDLKTPAGRNAIFNVLNGKASKKATAALRIVNGNNVLPKLLINPFCKDDEFSGELPGFVLGANGTLKVGDLSYVDYVGISPNAAPFQDNSTKDDFSGCSVLTNCEKERNPSALIVDGNSDLNAIPAQFDMEGSSAIYFRSGVDDNGDVNQDSFVVDANKLSFGPGNFVLSVEGQLDVIGDPEGNNALQILSLDVAKTGGSVFVESHEKVFPKRTFATDDCDRLLRFNKAAFLINNRMNLCDATLMHTDESHRIFDYTLKERPDVNSEPAYVGGETFKRSCQDRPAIALYNGEIKFHSSAAFTGLDIRVPNSDASPVSSDQNISFITFYSNGYNVDKDNGRFVVLGTLDGSFAADGSTIIDRDVHIDILQETDQDEETCQQLVLKTGFNNDSITKEIGRNDISGQCTRQTLYLGNSSNISIGTNVGLCDNHFPCEFSLVTKPELRINGDFIYFETRGGRVSAPETSGVTGEGGIFVDKNGKISLGECCRSSLAAMVVKSRDGIIDLPNNRALFDLRVGVTDWQIDLRGDEDERTIVAKDVSIDNYLIDWGNVVKDFDNFIPYEPKAIPNPSECAAVKTENISQLPIIKGQVNQLLVKRSRLGDKAHLHINGGLVRSLVFETGFFSDEAPLGVIVLDNFGRVGLGSTSRNIGDFASDTVLGINGITLVANGNGVVTLNEDIEINNTCAILAGPNFAPTSIVEQRITFFANEQREIRIKSAGILDLSSFDSPNKIVEFSGNVVLKLEPGARILLNGGTLLFSDNARMELEEVLDLDQLDDLTSARVKMVGTGFVIMEDNASMVVPEHTFFGIETDLSCNCGLTDIFWLLNDAARIAIGVGGDEGGAFQVGNLEEFSGTEAPLVSFNLTINGSGAGINLGRQAYFGLGAGVVNKTGTSPLDWQLVCLHNLGSISIDTQMGLITHNRIFDPSSSDSALLAVGDASGSYSFDFNNRHALIQGGGNMVLVEDCANPVFVKDLTVQLFASKDLLNDTKNGAKPVDATPLDFFNYLRAKDIFTMASQRSTIAQSEIGQLTLGFVCADPTTPLNPLVQRQVIPFVQGLFSGGVVGPVAAEPSLQRGAVAVIGNTNCIVDASEVFQINGFGG